MIIPAPIVPAPEPRGLRYGLLAAATGPLDLPAPHGRGGGVQYEPVSCGAARLYPVECDDEPTDKEFDPADEIITADPFVVYASLVCGTAGNTGAALETRVRRRLANGEQTGAELGMAAVLAAGATPVTAPDPADLVSVVGELEQWLYADQAYGNVGFLHASPRVAAYAATSHLIVADGPVWRTHMGTVWVFGGGYADGDVYISGNVTVWRSADVLVPPAAQTLDRATNQNYLIAEREYAVAYDCLAAAAAFDTGAIS